MSSSHRLFSILLSLIALQCLSAQVMYQPLDSAPQDLQVSRFDGSIVVSAGYMLHLLNPDFSLNSTVENINRQVGHRIALSHNATHVLLACMEVHCTHYEIDWHYEREIYRSSQIVNGFDGVPLSINPDGFYVASADPLAIVVKEVSKDGGIIRDSEPAIRNDDFYWRQFLMGFEHGGFVYFIARDNGTNDISNKVRIVRLCHHGIDERGFNAMYEVVLECGPISPNSKVEVSSNTINVYGNSVIVLSVTTDEETRIISFHLDDIDAEIDASYAICSSGNNNTLSIPLAWYTERTCLTFSGEVIDMCDFNLANHVQTIPALAAFKPVHGNNLLQFNNSEEITAVLAVEAGFMTKNELLFVAYSTSSTDHFLDKYHIRNDGSVVLVTREQHTLPVILLRWNEMVQEIYGGNTESVFVVPLERCANHTTCGECTGSRDPLCGWCPLEQYCSQSVDCPLSTHEGHWVNNEELCVVSISLAAEAMAVDFIQNVEVEVYPREASLPSSPVLGYQCSFYKDDHGNSPYAFTAPFSGGVCQLGETEISDFMGATLDLKFALHLSSQTLELFPSHSILSLHKCSQHSECGSCVEANDVCGWCVHDRVCTGNPATCRRESDWRSLANTQNKDGDEVCPGILTPDHGSYTLPVAVARDIELSTFNIPPEIPGYRYGCRLRYGNGTEIELEAHYYNHTAFRCHIDENQVHLLGDVANGSEATDLELLWTRRSDNKTVSIHTVKVTLYDCVQLGGDCSSCLSANIGTGFQCLWCDKGLAEDECTIFDHCRIQSTIFNSIENCPLPIISSIRPGSGPTLGGTVLTVSGSNLGAVGTDVSVELILIDTMNHVQCDVDITRYIPGKQVVCRTNEASEGEYYVSVNVLRGEAMARPLTLQHTFNYAHPIVNSIEPTQGPKAGGTEVLVLGSNLDISSHGVAMVFIGDVPCDIQYVTFTMIVCVTRPVSTASTMNRARLLIDNANMPSDLFTYTENPIFTTVEPRNTIPAGGVTLSFKGDYLDVVRNPELIIMVDGYELTGLCLPKSTSVLKCVSPRLPDEFSVINGQRIQQRRAAIGPINYTVIMDRAPGPSWEEDELQVVVLPNPVLLTLHTKDREYTLESGRSVRILGSDIDSVLPSELSVYVDGVTCIVATSDITPTQMRCFPPDTLTPGDRHVTVFVGESGLNYSVGFLRYNKATSGSTNSDLLLIIIPALTGVIVLMLTVLAVLCCSVGVLIRKKRAYKAKQRAAIHEEEKSEMIQVFPNKYNGNRNTTGEHDYDTIPDVLEEIQLQQMEMIACSGQHGLPITNLNDTKCKSNIYYSEDEGRGSSNTSGTSHKHSSSSSSSSRPASSNLSADGSRPHSSSTTGSLTYKNVKHPPLPPLPTSMSDEYVAMHSYSINNSTEKDMDSKDPDKEDTHTTPTAATVTVHEPTTNNGNKKGGNEYDKLEPTDRMREKEKRDEEETAAPESVTECGLSGEQHKTTNVSIA